MLRHQRRTLGFATLGLLGVWVVAGTGWTFANRAKATAEKVSSLLHEENPANLAPAKRTETLDALSRQMAELPMEERLKARLDEGWKSWFASMSDEEKRRFIEATLPGGLKQMLANFEKLPEAKRRRAISDALRDLKRVRELAASDEQSGIRIGYYLSRIGFQSCIVTSQTFIGPVIVFCVHQEHHPRIVHGISS